MKQRSVAFWQHLDPGWVALARFGPTRRRVFEDCPWPDGGQISFTEASVANAAASGGACPRRDNPGGSPQHSSGCT
jgi:hypothetical protein